MSSKTMSDWNGGEHKQKRLSSKSAAFLCAAVLCLSAGAYALAGYSEKSERVMSVLSTGFEYDETMGRLQYVSSILPDSAMVFLNGEAENAGFCVPSSSDVAHEWSEQEPWIEFVQAERVAACGSGDIMTVVKNRNDEYTVRLLHSNGYESIYSGLKEVSFAEDDRVSAGDILGNANGRVSFELRKDGLSILPVFGMQGE